MIMLRIAFPCQMLGRDGCFLFSIEGSHLLYTDFLMVR